MRLERAWGPFSDPDLENWVNDVSIGFVLKPVEVSSTNRKGTWVRRGQGQAAKDGHFKEQAGEEVPSEEGKKKLSGSQEVNKYPTPPAETSQVTNSVSQNTGEHL